MSFKFRCKNLTTWRQNLLFYFLAKNKTKQNTLINLHRRASLHVRTAVETLETICNIYLDSNKQRHISVCAAQLLLQASPSPIPTKNHNNIGFPSKTGPHPLNKITKLPSQPSMLGHHRHASETPYIYGGSLAGR